MIDLLVTCHNPHPRALTWPSYLEVLRARDCAPTPFIILISKFTFESFKVFGGVWYMVMVGVKQHKAHKPQKKKWVLTCKVYILLLSRPNCVANSIVKINPPSIK